MCPSIILVGCKLDLVEVGCRREVTLEEARCKADSLGTMYTGRGWFDLMIKYGIKCEFYKCQDNIWDFFFLEVPFAVLVPCDVLSFGFLMSRLRFALISFELPSVVKLRSSSYPLDGP